MANAAAAVEGKKEIDGLDTEDQMRWVEELLENGRLHFKHFLVEPDFVNKLVVSYYGEFVTWFFPPAM